MDLNCAGRSKNKKPQLPVIFLTANDLEEDVLNGFDLGAEDYVTKPFNMNILLRESRSCAPQGGRRNRTQIKNITGIVSQERTFFMEEDAYENERLYAPFYKNWNSDEYRKMLKNLILIQAEA